MEMLSCRGKPVDKSVEWVYGTGITDFLNMHPDRKGCWLWSNYGWVEVIPKTVGRAIGFQDYRKQEIYEGDYYKKIGSQVIMGPSYVYYNVHTACWGSVAWNHSFTPFYNYCVHGSTDGGGVVCGKMLDWENYEIIGTIYDKKSEEGEK